MIEMSNGDSFGVKVDTEESPVFSNRSILTQLKQLGFLTFYLILFSACSTLKKPFYYEAEKGTKKIHVLGTVHAGFGISELPNYVVKDLENDRGFAGEMNTLLTKKTEDKYFKKYYERQKTRYDWNRARNTKSNTAFTAEEWKLIKDKINSRYKDRKTIDEEEYSYMPPYFIKSLVQPRGVTIYVSHAQKYGMSENLDFQIYERVTDLKKHQMPLDVEFAITDECADQIDILYIKKVIRLSNDEYSDHATALVDQLFAAYESGEESKIIDFLESSRDPQLAQCLLIERNKR